MAYNEINGDLIALAKQGMFDVIAHGCNCHCRMGAGIAPQMAAAFGCNKFELEKDKHAGDINKLGSIDFEYANNYSGPSRRGLIVINAYTQFNYNQKNGIPLDYDALTLCLRKINFIFKDRIIGLPQIGCGLAGGDWNVVKQIIKTELIDCDVTIVMYKK